MRYFSGLLKNRLSKGLGHLGNLSGATSAARLDFERAGYVKRIFERVRTELIEVCGTQLPVTMIADSTNTPSDVTYSLSPEKSIVIGILCRAAWQSEIYEKTAHIHLGAKLLAPDQVDTALNDALRPALEATIGGEEDETVNAISNEVAKLIGLALTRIEATGGAVIALYGTSI